MNDDLFKISKVEQKEIFNLVGKIDDLGRLIIYRPRKGKLIQIPQCCPYSLDPNTISYCADGCPHFGEIEMKTINGNTVTNGKMEEKSQEFSVSMIPICNGKVLRFIQLEDMRKIEGDQNGDVK